MPWYVKGRYGLISCMAPYIACSEVKFDSLGTINSFYNIPRACLLNTLPAPTMDLKSNKSGL